MSRDSSWVVTALRELDPYDFERFVADLWERQGFETAVTTRSNDRGIDVVATTETPYRQKVVIQAKRNADGNNVGVREIQQYNSIRKQADADVAVVVTTSGFTAAARDVAEELNVKRVDGSRLAGIVAETDSEDLVRRYREGNAPKRAKQATLDERFEAEDSSDERDDAATRSTVGSIVRTAVLVALLGAVLFVGVQFVAVGGGPL